jgi:hypothetical protein
MSLGKLLAENTFPPLAGTDCSREISSCRELGEIASGKSLPAEIAFEQSQYKFTR